METKNTRNSWRAGWTRIALLAALLGLAACSSQVPPEIRQEVEKAPTVAEVRQQPELYLDSRVRWGGIILSTENRDQSSWLTVISLPLKANGRPESSDHSPGRFIAIVDEFLEPLLYSRDRMVTFTGRIQGHQTSQVGEFAYDYPLLKVEHYYLWPQQAKLPEYEYPYFWYYDPWYHPLHYPRYPYRLVPPIRR